MFNNCVTSTLGLNNVCHGNDANKAVMALKKLSRVPSARLPVSGFARKAIVPAKAELVWNLIGDRIAGLVPFSNSEWLMNEKQSTEYWVFNKAQRFRNDYKKYIFSLAQV